jgi:hypothetical protein
MHTRISRQVGGTSFSYAIQAEHIQLGEKPHTSSAPPIQNPHSLEREKRNRESLLKKA